MICRTHFLSHLKRCLLALWWVAGVASADVAVIVHQDSPWRELSAKQVSDLYLGRLRSLEGVEMPRVLEQPSDSPLRERFYRGLNGMGIKQLNAYWARLRFSGEVLPHESLADSRAVLSRVRRDRNAIGYIDPATLDHSVRVVLVVKE